MGSQSTEHSSHPMEEIIIDVLELFVGKLKKGDCSLSQVNAAYKAITENMDVFATADELSEHFGKSRTAVHGVIKRNMTENPLLVQEFHQGDASIMEKEALNRRVTHWRRTITD